MTVSPHRYGGSTMYAVALRVLVAGAAVLVAGCSMGPAVGFDAPLLRTFTDALLRP